MLKVQSTTAAVNSTLKFAPLVGRLDSPTSHNNTPGTITILNSPAINTSSLFFSSINTFHTTASSRSAREFTAEDHHIRRYKPMIMAAHGPDSRDPSPAPIEQASKEERKRNSRGIGAFFPLGYKEACQQWWASISPPHAERNVLRYVPFLREATSSSPAIVENASAQSDPYGNRIWRSTMVTLSGKNRALNEYSVERLGEELEETLVVLHGYGAGLGFFYKNFEGLTRLPGWRMYALDMLGMGNSSRPSFRVTAKDQKTKIEQAESWFVDALEEWRKIRRIERFTLLGHSLGGYLAVSYALKYPGRLNKLILASPVGIPEDPYAINAEMPEPSESALANEFTIDQTETTTHHENDAVDENSSSTQRNRNADPAVTKGREAPKRPLPPWFVWLWDANVSPFSIVRMAGPLGPRFVSGWTSRRFNHLPSEEAQALHDYSYALFRQRGSGEYALPYLLAPGAYARSPIINRIHKVGRQTLMPATETSPAIREAGIPIVMMYGENDWMDVAGGFAAKEKILETCEKMLVEGTEEERKRENGGAKVIIIPASGHHLYLDNPENFNKILRKEMTDTQQWMNRARELLPKVAEKS